MLLENKLGITDAVKLAHEEERLSKQAALRLFESGELNQFPVGSIAGLVAIHKALFKDIYPFAGEIRNVNLAKGNFRFAPVMYLQQALEQIERMPQSTFDEIVSKYIEVNVAHPFREGNGRSMRLWLDCMLRAALAQVVDWSKINKEDYLFAMERSPVRSTEIKTLLRSALTPETTSREVYMKGIDASYAYEGYTTYFAASLEL